MGSVTKGGVDACHFDLQGLGNSRCVDMKIKTGLCVEEVGFLAEPSGCRRWKKSQNTSLPAS